MESRPEAPIDDIILLGVMELVEVLLVGEARCLGPLDTLSPVMICNLKGAVCFRLALFERIHFRSEANVFCDGVTGGFILHQSHLRLVILEVALVVGVRRGVVGEVVPSLLLDHVCVYILRLHLIHQRICIGEEEARLFSILRLHHIVVESK